MAKVDGGKEMIGGDRQLAGSRGQPDRALGGRRRPWPCPHLSSAACQRRSTPAILARSGSASANARASAAHPAARSVRCDRGDDRNGFCLLHRSSGRLLLASELAIGFGTAPGTAEELSHRWFPGDGRRTMMGVRRGRRARVVDGIGVIRRGTLGGNRGTRRSPEPSRGRGRQTSPHRHRPQHDRGRVSSHLRGSRGRRRVRCPRPASRRPPGPGARGGRTAGRYPSTSGQRHRRRPPQ